MKKIIFSCILLVGIIWLVFANFKSDEKNDVQFSKKRTFNIGVEKISSFPIGFSPAFVEADYDNIELLNFNDQKLYIMDFLGGIIDSLGGGHGDGPMENDHIYSFDIGPNYYFTFDVVKQSINKVNNKNELIEFYTDSLRMENAVHISKNQFLVSYESEDQSLSFQVLDISTKEKTNLPKANKIFPKVPHAYWVYEGRFCKDKENNIIYITYYSNDILKFDKAGKMTYRKKLIHETPLIQIKEQGDLVIPSANSNPSALDATIDGKYIYVLSTVSENSKSENKNQSFLDVYFLQNGKYDTSLALPNFQETPPMDIAVTDDKLILVYQTAICIYEMSFK